MLFECQTPRFEMSISSEEVREGDIKLVMNETARAFRFLCLGRCREPRGCYIAQQIGPLALSVLPISQETRCFIHPLSILEVSIYSQDAFSGF